MNTITDLFPRGEANTAYAAYFTGNSWLSMLSTEGVVRDGAGRPTGLLMETRAMSLVTSLPDFPAPDMAKSLARACHVYASRGVTTAAKPSSLP